ncbi:MAG: pantoate--beta-alanine ligase, partial [Actinobacteria bacterium]|nr:pantoate--beta-alanine ligase [Actinomycetota bacterium]
MTIALLRSRAELDDLCAHTERSSRAVVMTMGALHQGHAALIRAARTDVGSAGTVIATVYV